MIYGNRLRYGAHYLLKTFASSLFNIFIPIYLYVNGFSLVQVGIFYFFQEVFSLIFAQVLYRKIYSWGVKNMLILGTLIEIILIFIIYKYMNPTHAFLLLLSFIRGLHNSFYWGANEVIMVHLSENEVGTFLAKWNFVMTILQILIVPISAYVLDHNSPFWLIIISIFLLTLSIIPFLKIELPNLKNNFVVPLLSLIKLKDNQYIGIVSHGNEFLTKISETIIPIYIFVIFDNYFSVGIAGSFSIIGTAFYSYFVSCKSEESHSRKLFLMLNIIACLVVVPLFIIFNSKILIYFLIFLLAFSRLGVYLSSTVGINKLCLVSDCYARKMFARMAENIAGIVVGLLLIISGMVSFKIVFFLSSLYMVLIFIGIYILRESI